MNHYVFKPGCLLWDAVTSLVKELVMKRQTSQQVISGSPFLGRYCRLKATNPSHLFCVTQNQPFRECIFDELPPLADINKCWNPLDDDESIQQIQQAAFINAYDQLLPRIVAKWPLPGQGRWDREKAPRIVDFCYHIRNGAAHGNRFNFDVRGRKVKVYPNTKWRQAVITEALECKRVMGLRKGFLGAVDVIVLLSELERSV